MTRLDAHAVIAVVTDHGSWTSWDTPLTVPETDSGYAGALVRARAATGLDEAVITGRATVRGHHVAVLVSDFGFLGGSIGIAAGRRITAAIHRATAERLPLLALPTSGGTRMQEGTSAFLQMIDITAAVVAHKAAHLPYLVYLRHPTTGGVFASWGSLGHITLAEPGALIGFLGPRIYETLSGAPFPEGVQTAENLHAHGLVDAVLPLTQLPETVDRALSVMTAVPGDAATAMPSAGPRAPTAWHSICASRRQDRPGVHELLDRAASDTLRLHGTGQGETEPGIVLALARFGGRPCVLVGQDRRGQTDESPMGPAALRQARRGMRMAAELDLPLVTVIDTPGAALSPTAEEGGLAGEIAHCLADMLALRVPTISVLLGQGSGGGAIALLPADRILAAQHGWLAPLPPEGASALLYHDTTHAAAMTAQQGVRAADLLAYGLLDEIIAEDPDAAEEPDAFIHRVGAAICRQLLGFESGDPTSRLSHRAQRLGRITGPHHLPEAG